MTDIATFVEVDVVLAQGETTDGFIADLKEFRGLDAECVNPTGPAGGNPVFRVSGPTPALTAFLTDEDGMNFDRSDLQELFGIEG